jgi:hypothetical protein
MEWKSVAMRSVVSALQSLHSNISCASGEIFLNGISCGKILDPPLSIIYFIITIKHSHVTSEETRNAKVSSGVFSSVKRYKKVL